MDSDEGKSIIRFHDAGYPLAAKQSDLTPLQWLFLIRGFNKQNQEQQEQVNKQPNHSNNQSAEQQKQQVMQMLKERRGY
ncbi:hypothetical protein [Bacillus coahuilensis]|uniref:hypothetical protein n=1 Tax=Bacillus coahuilensis TaxID=408580 RepID=UPI000185091D|nr:hypothetical protein [Bacillus coahuilensis]